MQTYSTPVLSRDVEQVYRQLLDAGMDVAERRYDAAMARHRADVMESVTMEQLIASGEVKSVAAAEVAVKRVQAVVEARAEAIEMARQRDRAEAHEKALYTLVRLRERRVENES